MSNTEPLDVNKITHKIPHGEMAARTYLVFGHRIACIFYSNISQNPPQSVKSNTKNILPFVRSTVFFLLYFYAKVTILSLTGASKPVPKANFFTVETLHSTNKINKHSLGTILKMFSIVKLKNQKCPLFRLPLIATRCAGDELMKNKSNHLYLKTLLTLQGDINLILDLLININ